jgi:6-phosphogluconolactonase
MGETLIMKIFNLYKKQIRFFMLALLLVVLSGMSFAAGQKESFIVYVGTYTGHGSQGIYAYRFDEGTGKLSAIGLAAETASPSFLVLSNNKHFLYAVNELENYQGKPSGGVSAFAIQPSGEKLTFLNELPSRGEDPAHLALDRTGKYLLVANYTSGNVTVFPVLKDGSLGEATAFVQHHGSGVNHERQEGPHAHEIVMSPDNRFALITDLGLDEIFSYPFNPAKGTLGEPHITKSHPGAGPRHLVFSRDGKFLYVIHELQSTVVAYSYHPEKGELKELQSISSLPDDFKGKSTAGEIALSPSGKFLYASNRGSDSIKVFSVDSIKGTLKPVEVDSVLGKTPRDFVIDPSGRFLLAANQDSGNIVVYRINQASGHLTPTGDQTELSSPVCLQFLH